MIRGGISLQKFLFRLLLLFNLSNMQPSGMLYGLSVLDQQGSQSSIRKHKATRKDELLVWWEELLRVMEDLCSNVAC